MELDGANPCRHGERHLARAGLNEHANRQHGRRHARDEIGESIDRRGARALRPQHESDGIDAEGDGRVDILGPSHAAELDARHGVCT